MTSILIWTTCLLIQWKALLKGSSKITFIHEIVDFKTSQCLYAHLALNTVIIMVGDGPFSYHLT